MDNKENSCEVGISEVPNLKEEIETLCTVGHWSAIVGSI